MSSPPPSIDEILGPVVEQKSATVERHQRTHALYQAVTETIGAQGATRSPGTYVSATMMFVDSMLAKPTHKPFALYSALRILALVIPYAPPQLLVSRGDDMLTMIGSIVARDDAANDVALLRVGTICLSHILAVLPRSNYRATPSVAADALNGILMLALHAKAKVRKEAIAAAELLLGITPTSRVSPKTVKYVRKAVEAFVLAAFDSVPESDLDKGSAAELVTSQLRILSLLKTSVTKLEARATFRILAALFARLGEVSVARTASSRSVYTGTHLAHLRLHLVRAMSAFAAAIDDFGAVFAEDPDKLVLFVDSLTEVIPPSAASGAMLEFGEAESSAAPSSIDVEIEFAYVKIMRTALFVLGLLNTAAAGDRVPPFVQRCVDLLTSSTPGLAAAALEALRRVLGGVVELGHLGSGALHAVVSILATGLSYKYKPAWGGVLSAAAALFVPLTLDRSDSPGAADHNAAVQAAFGAGIGDLLTRAAELANQPEFMATAELYHCVGEAIRAFGPGPVCAVIPMALVPPADTGDAPAPSNDWMILVLKKYVIRAKLSYFMQYIEPAANAIQARALAALNDDDMPVLAKNLSMRAVNLWALFGAFCRVPTDLDAVWPSLATLAGRALESEPQLRRPICAGLRRLIALPLAVANGTVVPGSPPEAKAKVRGDGPYAAALNTALAALTPAGRVHALHTSLSPEQAQTALATLADAAPEFIQLLVTLYLDTPADARFSLGSTLTAFATIGHTKAVDKLFKKIVKVLLQGAGDTSASAEQRAADEQNLTDLAALFVPGLSDASLGLLYKIVRPQLASRNASLQKSSYKVLAGMLEASPTFLAAQLEDVFVAIREGSATARPAARAVRFSCLAQIIAVLPPQHLGAVFSDTDVELLLEAVLATREPGKAKAAMEVVAAIVSKVAADGGEHGPCDLATLTSLILAGLTDSDSEVVAGTLGVYVYIASKHRDALPDGFLDRTFATVLALLRVDITSIVRVALVLTERLVKVVADATLTEHLATLAESLLDYAGHRKSSFRRIIKSIWLLVVPRVGGFDAIKAAFKADHARYFANLRRDVRKAKNTARRGAVAAMDESGSGSDSDSGDDINDIYLAASDDDAAASASAPAALSGLGMLEGVDGEDDFVDFLDPSASSHVMSGAAAEARTKSKPKAKRKGKAKAADDDAGGEFRVLDDGRIVVVDKGPGSGSVGDRKAKRRRDRDDDNASGDGGDDNGAASRTVLYQSRKRTKVLSGGVVESGSRFKAKKAAGDVKKGDVDPYAYIRAEARDLNKRNRRKAVSKYEGVIGAAKGAAKRASKKKKQADARRRR